MRAACSWRLCLGGLALLIGLPAWGQAPITPPATYLSRHWTTNDGLPVNTINDLAQTPDGFLWIATWDGLVRFDGLHFRSYTAANTEGLPSSRMALLYADREGNLWIMTEQRELVRYRDGVFTPFDETNGLPGLLTGPSVDFTRAFQETASGLFFGTEQGLALYRDGQMEPFLPTLIEDPITTLAGTLADTLWLGTATGVVYRVGPDSTVQRLAAADGLFEERIYTIVRDAEGRLWVGGEQGLRYWHGRRFVPVPAGAGVLDAPVLYAVPDPEGQVEIGTSTGDIYRTQPGKVSVRFMRASDRAQHIQVVVNAKNRFTGWAFGLGENDATYQVRHKGRVVFTLPPGLAPLSFWVDQQDRAWLGTREGLFELYATPITVWRRPRPTPDGAVVTNVYPIVQGPKGAVWLGTLEDDLLRIAGDQVQVWNRETKQFWIGHPWALHVDRSGVLWVGGYGLCRMTEPPERCMMVASGNVVGERAGVYQDVGEVRAIYQDTQERFWVGGQYGLAYRDGDTWHRVTEAPGVTHPWVRAIHEQPDGSLWFGTNGGGLFRFRDDTFEPFSRAQGSCSNLVRAFYQDDDGYLWVATEDQGLCRITNPSAPIDELQVASLSQAQGLGESGIHTVLEDDYGRFWMSTNRGLLSVPREDLNAVADGHLDQVHPVRYDERDGMRHREANGGVQPAALKDRQGRIWFATQDGAVMLDPARLLGGEAEAPLVVDAATSGGEALPLRGGIRLAPAQRDLTISYTVPRFDKPEAVRFQYRLLGQDDDWFDAGTERQARFTNLGPGRFTFQVRALDAFGHWESEAAELVILRAPLFRETGWFALLMALAAAVLVFGGVRYQVRRVAARNRSLEQRVADRTRELQTALATVAEQAEELKSLDAAKSRFFANVSHEFRTPLTLIIGPLRSLLAGQYGALPPAAAAQHQLMLRNSRRLLRLVNQILDLAQLERGGIPLQAQRQDLVPFVRAIVEAFRPLVTRHGLQLTFTHPPYPCWLYFDPQHLEVVLLNLFSNAFKFTEAGGEVHVKLEEGEAVLLLSVTDTGRGITPEGLEKIFDRFYQEEGSQGTGIGLALVQELVRLHGGEITATSTVGEGTRFVVRLRKGREHLWADQVVADQAVASDPAGDGWHSEPPPSLVDASPELLEEVQEEAAADVPTVLIVDDNPDIRQYLRSILAPSYRVLEASDGASGLQRVREDLPDLVVSDVMMPHQDGFAFSRALKTDAMTAHIPVILLTAKASQASALEGLDTGADDYLTKPFDADELLARIRNQLATRQRLRARYQGDGASTEAGRTGAAAEAHSLEAQARQVIREHLSDPGFTVRDLAAHLNLTYATFNRQLRTETQVKPATMIRQMRLEEAAVLLKQQAGSVSEVAYGVGFNNLSYFSRCFREHYGVLPSAYPG